MKDILGIYSAPLPHWVGDGFPVRTLFSFRTQGHQISPFLLLDHAGPMNFLPTDSKRGVGTHPHRGFETVTIVYEGEVAHTDSTGQGGVVGPGDVQWMTAGSGILHEEYHSKAFSRNGGTLEMMQLWVNLPKEHKMTAPKYQAICKEDIPYVRFPNGQGHVRVIAGDYDHVKGPASTFSPMQVLDILLAPGGRQSVRVPKGWSSLVVVRKGTATINCDAIDAAQVAVLSLKGRRFEIASDHGVEALILSGSPIDEPIVGYGPFVMNSAEEIQKAIADFQQGNFGSISR